MEYFRARLILDAFCKVFVRSRLIAFEREQNQDSNLFPFFLQSGQPKTAVASGSPVARSACRIRTRNKVSRGDRARYRFTFVLERHTVSDFSSRGMRERVAAYA